MTVWAIIPVKPLVRAKSRLATVLTPDQLAILDEAKNQWRENHGQEANDPSAN